MVKTFAPNFYMIIKWAKGRGIQITTIFKFLSFTTVFAQSKVHLSDGIDREYTFQNQTSNLLSISAQGFLRTNIDCWINWTLLNRNQLWMAYSEFANEISQQTFVLMKTSWRIWIYSPSFKTSWWRRIYSY